MCEEDGDEKLGMGDMQAENIKLGTAGKKGRRKDTSHLQVSGTTREGGVGS